MTLKEREDGWHHYTDAARSRDIWVRETEDGFEFKPKGALLDFAGRDEGLGQTLEDAAAELREVRNR